MRIAAVDHDIEYVPEQPREVGLFSGVLWQAFMDTKNAEFAMDAIDFLMTDRSDYYFYLSGIDPDDAREYLFNVFKTTPWFHAWQFKYRRSERKS